MPDDLDRLRRLFAKGNEEAEETSPGKDEEASPFGSRDDKVLDEIWGRKSGYDKPEEEDGDKPAAADDEPKSRPQSTQGSLIKPFIPPKVEKPEAKPIVEKSPIEHLHERRLEPEEETQAEVPPERDKSEAEDIPHWALGVASTEAEKSEFEKIRERIASEYSADAYSFGDTSSDEEPPESSTRDAFKPPPEDDSQDISPDDFDNQTKEPYPEPVKPFEKIRSVADLNKRVPAKSLGSEDDEIEQPPEVVNELRDILFNQPTDDGAGKPRRKRPVYHEPKAEINPLVSFIGLIGAICMALALLMTLFGAKAGLGTVGLSGIGLLMVIIYSIANRKNLKLVLSARSTRYGTNVILVILSLLGMLIVVNAIGYQHYIVIDTTAEKLHSLSDQTLEVLKQLRDSKQEITATVFIPRENEFAGYRDILEDTLAKYQYQLHKLDIEYLDPDVSRQRAEALGFEDRVGVVFQSGDKHEKAIEFTPKSPLSFEVALTGALLRLTGTHAKRVYFLTGHYELSYDDFTEQNLHSAGLFAQSLELAGYQISPLNFSTKAEVPVDCSLLIIAGPEKELTPEEVGAVKSYIDKGGRVILLLEARNSAGFAPLLEEEGIHFRADLIGDDINNLLGSNNLYPVLDLNEHAVTAPLKRKGMDVVFFKASGLDVDSNRPPGEFVERLLSTKAGGGSWSESGEEENARMDPEEERGPFTMAVLAGKEIKEKPPVEEAKAVEGEKAEDKTDRSNWGLMLVTGDASFIANPNLKTYGNKDFILNAVDYMTSDRNDLTIRPKETAPLLALTKSQGNIVFLISTVFIPLLVAALGVTVWLRRK